MKAAHKRALYLDPEVEEILAKSPPKKVSERANELMRKGLQKEKEEAIAREYQRYAEALSKEQRVGPRKSSDKMTSTQLSYRLFKSAEPGDDPADDDEDLI